MLPFCAEYLRRLQELHEDMERTVEGLPQTALDWVPGTGMNSLVVLLVHTAGAERYWVGDVVAGQPLARDRDAEFRTRGLDATQLRKRLAETLSYTRSALEGLTLQDLEATRTSPREGRSFTVAWSLAHVLAHTGIHVGHMQLTRQLWQEREIA